MEDRLMEEAGGRIDKLLVEEPARAWSPGFRWSSLAAVIIADPWMGS
jgi:hypothetical protein